MESSRMTLSAVEISIVGGLCPTWILQCWHLLNVYKEPGRSWVVLQEMQLERIFKRGRRMSAYTF
jgi:hypothetical protein